MKAISFILALCVLLCFTSIVNGEEGVCIAESGNECTNPSSPPQAVKIAKGSNEQGKPPEVDPRATTWAKKKENSWFGRDEAMTAAAFAIDKKMQEEGTDPTAADYYELLDEKIQEAFPHKFEKEGKSFPIQAVGRNSVGTNPNTRKTKKVKLTASQQAIAKKLGVPLEEYAKYV